MNPLRRQLAIREFELFVSGGINEVPRSVYEKDIREAGESRPVRAPYEEIVMPFQNYPSISLGKVKIDLKTAKVVE